MAKKNGNVGFGTLKDMGVMIKDNQGKEFDNPRHRGKNNVFKKGGVEAF